MSQASRTHRFSPRVRLVAMLVFLLCYMILLGMFATCDRAHRPDWCSAPWEIPFEGGPH
jgi:hypothetical protein